MVPGLPVPTARRGRSRRPRSSSRSTAVAGVVAGGGVGALLLGAPAGVIMIRMGPVGSMMADRVVGRGMAYRGEGWAGCLVAPG